MRLFLLLFAAALLFSRPANAQCNLKQVTLQQRVQASSLVVEGTVVAAWSRWDDLHQNIYTVNVVEVLGTFKGTLADTLVYIVTPGGRVGMDLEIQTHAVELNKGKTGLFTLIANSKPLTENTPLYEIYAATQGFLQYGRLDRKARGVFDSYDHIEQDLYPALLSQPGTVLQRRKAIRWSAVNDRPYALSDLLESSNSSYLQGDSLSAELVLNAVSSGATISSFTPATVQAGRDVLLTINGSGFGATQGTSYVQFPNADAGGASYISPAATQYLSWSDSQIQVYVPTGAGTGAFRVSDGTNTATSSSSLTVEYAILNVSYSGSNYRPNLVDDNGTGGYTFQMNTAFDASTAAKTDFQNVIYQWRCASGVNWIFGPVSSITSTAADGVNIVRFDSGTELSAGVLGVCASRYSGCLIGATIYWYVNEMDVTIDDGTNFFYGNSGAPSFSQYDFYSVMLHELGHGHQLGHVIDATKVMHYSITNGQQKRTISPTELTGAVYELSQSTVGSTCGVNQHVDYSCNPLVTLSSSGASISENGAATLTATLSKRNFSDVTVTLGYSGSATSGTDYASSVTLTIPAGTLSASVTLTAVDDLLDEPDETAIVAITAVTNGTESGTQQQTITILDNDAAPTVTLSAANATIAENGSTSVTATLSAVSGQTVTVTLGLTGTATITTDYTLGTTITIPAGSNSATISLAAVNDVLDEQDETVIADITAVTNGTENGTQQQTVTILDNDAAPTVTLSKGSATVAETGGSTTITATLSAVSGQTVTVALGLTGTATVATDYTIGTTITIPAGSNSATISLAAVNDASDEPDETVIIDITGVTNGTESGTQQQTVTILDDDAAPTVTLSAANATIAENGSTTVTATLSAVSSQTVTVTLGLTGTAVVATDYTLGTTITIPAGNSSATISLAAVNDASDEPDETVIIDITGVTNGTESGTQQQTVTILDDDAAPTVTLSAANATIAENGSTTVTATLSAVSSQTVTVTLGLTGTAVVAADYTLGTTITIPAGNSSATISLSAVNDALDEQDETVIIDIASVTNGTENGTQQQTVTILDDDAAPTVTLSAANATIAENGSTTVTATLSAVSGQTVTVALGLTGTAIVAADYMMGTTITIPAGNSSATISVSAVNDALDEPDETVIIDIASVTSGTESGTQQQTVTILDDDAAPTVTLSAGNATIAENGSTTVTATLSAISGQNVSVTLGFTGTATTATDYTLGTTITIPAGNSSATISLAAVNDASDEPDETVIIDIASVTNGTENGTQQQTVTILDDDAASTVTLSTANMVIAENGSTTVTATLSAVSSQVVTVTIGTTGMASASDYALGTTITIPAGNSSASLVLSATDDLTDEPDETVIIDITGVTNGTESGTQQQTVTILDDDAAPTVTLSAGNATIIEGGITTITATLSAISAQTVTVTLGFSGTAIVAADYMAGSTITIPAGSSSAMISLVTLSDPSDEPDETVIIHVTGVTNGSENGTQQQTVTILDDDAAPTVTLSPTDATIAENGATTVTATLSAISGQNVSVTLDFTGTATVTADYTAGTTITIPAGNSSATISLAAIDDAVDEQDETVIIDITGVTNGTENGTQQQTVTILDNDATPGVALSVATATIAENGGTTTVTATLSGISEQNVILTLDLSGTAASGTDYTVPVLLTIPAGSLSASVTLSALNDANGEPDESIVLSVANAINAVFDGMIQVVTISDDEEPEIQLAVSGTAYSDGSAFDFGIVPAGTTVSVEFSVFNNGQDELLLNEPDFIVLTGPGAASYTVETAGLSASIPAGDSAVFTVEFTAGCSSSALSATLVLASNDTDEGNYTILLGATPQDQTAPVPDNAALSMLAGECSVTVTTIPSATDNCSGAVTATSSSPMSYTTPGTFNITWVFTDAAGNTATQQQQVVVAGDATAPEIVCQDNIVSTSAVVTFSAPTASDNCSTPVITQLAGPASGTTFPEGTTTITYTATDAAGNADTCSFTVLVDLSGLSEYDEALLQLYPNPANETVNVAGNFEAARICDSKGMLVATYALSGNTAIDVRELQTGLYYITFTGPGASVTRKLEVTH